MKHLFVVFIFFAGSFPALSQQDAWVYLSDKENVSASLANPTTILTQKALNRKNRHNVAIDERDVPVNENYISQLKSQTGITVMAKSKWFNAVHVRGSETDINALKNLSFVSRVDFADKSLNTSRVSQPNDKFVIEDIQVDFAYGSTQNQVEMINVNSLHIDDFTGEGITIAVLDAGFPNVNTMGAFQRLRNNGDLLGGYDFVDRTPNVYAFSGNSHGTNVLSTMAGFIQDQYVGTAPDASYYVFRTEDVFSETPVEESYWVEAAERADSLGVDIINTSLGYFGYDNPNYSYTAANMNGQTAFISKGANIASEKGILVVTSAGNAGNSSSYKGVGAPADAAGVLSIGAVDANGQYAFFSSRGSEIQPTQKPDVVAKGLAAAVITSGNAIASANGTSFSSPIMAGGIASLWQALPDASNFEIMDVVRRSASQYETPDYFLGYGIPDLALAFELGFEAEEEVFEFKLFPNPVWQDLFIHIPSTIEEIKLIIYDVLGKAIIQQQLSKSKTSIDVSELSSGWYMVRLQNKNTSKTYKLIKS
ncbi:S8 family serine peptidase [Geojedonia litorea]|uniref:S8 family serine peptidase n=1 Tax=Geojedonia litorea TaxID=1268269 RepID=A0ABV9MYT4_9FLAO